MVNFTLSALNQDLTVGISGELAGDAPAAWTDISAVAVYNVKLSDMLAVFKFQSDSFDVNDSDASDIQYYVYKNAWPATLKINPVHAAMTSGGTPGVILATGGSVVAAKNLVKHDFVRYLAEQLFNTPYGVDLFSNEEDLLSDLVTKGVTARTDGIDAALAAVDQASAAAGTAPHKYSTNLQNTPANICRELMRQVANAAPARFFGTQNITTVQSVPIADGDTINFRLSISPAAGQADLTERPEALKTRVYKIQLNVVDAETVTNVAPIEADSSTEYPYHAA